MKRSVKKIVTFSLVTLFLLGTGFSVLALRLSLENQIVTVGTTATKLPTTPLVGRKFVFIQNIGSATVYLGKSDVTADEVAATGGVQLAADAYKVYPYNHSVDVYGIVASGTCKVAVEEGK